MLATQYVQVPMKSSSPNLLIVAPKMKLSIIMVFNVQFSSVKYSNTVMQVIFITPSILQNQNSRSIKHQLLSPSVQLLITTMLLSVSVNLTVLITVRKWDNEVLCLL